MNDMPSLEILLNKLRLPSMKSCHEEMAVSASNNNWSYLQFLQELSILELHERKQRRIERNLKKSGLSTGKTLAALDHEKLPKKVIQSLPQLCSGGFVDRAENVLAFGNPGTGKTHVTSAICNELVLNGYKVLFTPAYRLVQHLLVSKRKLELEKCLKKLDIYDVIALDDIGYIQQDREEMEVLFTFLAERYERRSIMITSNLVFSQWDRIFKDPLTTAAAIDRLVHHSTILEFNGKSYRTEAAKRSQ